MRHSGDWMTLLDDRILEYLSENEAASPTEMKKGGPLHFSRAYIGRRCRKLAEEGLIREISDAVYTITDDGEAYLNGVLDTQNWVRLDENGSSLSTDSTEKQEG